MYCNALIKDGMYCALSIFLFDINIVVIVDAL
jgi:hypothetical protein